MRGREGVRGSGGGKRPAERRRGEKILLKTKDGK